MSDSLPNLLPSLDAATEHALRESIKRFGVIVPVVTDQDGNVLDGHHRTRIADEFGVPVLRRSVVIRDEQHARELVADINDARRPRMDPEQRREVVGVLREAGHSLRSIAGAVGTSLGTVQRDIEAAPVSPDTPAEVVGQDGKRYPSSRPDPTPAPEPAPDPAEIAALPLESPVEPLHVVPEPEPNRAPDPERAPPSWPIKPMAVHYSSATDEWSTPEDFYAIVRDEFHPSLDVCALPTSAKCERYFTPEDDGLAQDWGGVCWMNPPYGRGIVEWVAKAHAEAEKGATVVALVPARVETRWWWDYCRHHEVRFIPGRLKFGDAETGAPFPSVLVIFGWPERVVWWDHRALAASTELEAA